ncbi:MAG: VWA domain-containing protein [Phycisphaerales bacterium]|nr:VWA domain-containing protein [Phycisphaerales bacterium]
MTFQSPSVWWLLLLLGLPLLAWYHWRRARHEPLRFSTLAPLRTVRPAWTVPARWIVPTLRAVVLVLLVVSLARPQLVDAQTRVHTEGVAIQLVVDRSGSMNALDFERGGRQLTRLDAVKEVVEAFIVGGERLPGRPDDLIGLVSFATYADSVCPVTLDHDHLVATVRDVRVSIDEEDQATAIGDAIALGVERIRSLDEQGGDDAMRIKSRVMILLTDGEHNAGEIDPMTAAEMAAAFDIKIYTIGAGSRDAVRRLDPRTGRPGRFRQLLPIDEATLRAIADRTGGQYFRATDADSLEAVYGRIDELERTEIERTQYRTYTELPVEPARWQGVTLPPLLAVAFVLLALELILGNTKWQMLP